MRYYLNISTSKEHYDTKKLSWKKIKYATYLSTAMFIVISMIIPLILPTKVSGEQININDLLMLWGMFFVFCFILPFGVLLLSQLDAYHNYKIKIIDNNFHNQLNKAFVLKNDHEKIVLLHELISEQCYKCVEIDENDNEFLKLTFDDKYEMYQPDTDRYSPHIIETLDRIIEQRSLSFEQALKMREQLVKLKDDHTNLVTMQDQQLDINRVIDKNERV